MNLAREYGKARLLACVLAIALASGCADPLVNESYATTGNESINGIDAFLRTLENEVVEENDGEVLQTASLTNRVRREADLVVYFEQDFVPDYQRDEYYRNLEAYLFGIEAEGLEPREGLEEEFETELPDGFDADDQDFDLDDQTEPVEIRNTGPQKQTAPRGLPEIVQGSSRLALQEDSLDSGSPDPESDLSDADEQLEEPADRFKTILYFLKDTTASVAFWSMLADQMREHPPQRAFCEEQQKLALISRSLDSIPYLAPLSSRRTLHAEGELIDDLRWDRGVFPAAKFPARGLRYPVRTVPGEPRSHFDILESEFLYSRSLLATADGEDLIRELRLPSARLILIYNSESFLNHSQVHPGNRRLALYLLRYSLNHRAWSDEHRPVAAVVRKLVKTETAAREEFDMLRFLKVFPLNVIVIHFFVLLLLFLLSRWPHARPPLENQASGSREFLEHIRALGVRLSRTTPRMKALEPLLRYKQKVTGRDYSAVIQKLEEAAGLPPEKGDAGTPQRAKDSEHSEKMKDVRRLNSPWEKDG
ncbi:MAG: hypothetical protein NXI24_03630 [bacterium]|nr:hypothetical protein [bacterium]